MAFIIRARLFHTPDNPFTFDDPSEALVAEDDGAIAVAKGRIVASGSWDEVRGPRRDWSVVDRRPALLMPGFVDAHVHFSQFHIIGAMGQPLLQWLEQYTLPEEVRLRDEAYARGVARRFLASLARNGTTSALVFGSHLPTAQHIFFEEAATSGLRIASGLALADRMLLPELHTTAERAYEDSLALAKRWHRASEGLITYAVTPRFALSAGESMLEVCGALLDAVEGGLFQTHINENKEEIEEVARLFPWASDYLAVYERYGLVRPGAVYAHNVHVCDRQLGALAGGRAAVAHCPTSNGFLGSGLFSLRRHVNHGVQVALGSDVGAGTGFGIPKEGLMAYKTQMLQEDGYPLTPIHLLYLATAAGAKALQKDGEVGDLSPGKAADFVLLDPPPTSTLAEVLTRAASPAEVLGALFTLADEQSVAETFVAGRIVYRRPPAAP